MNESGNSQWIEVRKAIALALHNVEANQDLDEQVVFEALLSVAFARRTAREVLWDLRHLLGVNQ